MDEKTKHILLLNHDVNNHLSIALGYFDLLLDDRHELKNDSHTSYILEGLTRASDLSAELGSTCATTDKIHTIIEKEGFIKIKVQDHFEQNVKPDIKRLNHMYDIDINVRFTIIDETKSVFLNPKEIFRARENIISNAIAAGASQLDINFEMKKFCFAVSYTDNGKGMSQEEIDKISLSLHGDGTVHGLGTKSILETGLSHSISVTYTSEIGVGTTVRALVPYCSNQEE